MDRITLRSYAGDAFVDDLECQFRTPLREQGMRLICRRRPKDKRYDAVYPLVVKVGVLVLVQVAAKYLVRLIDFIVRRRSQYTNRSVLLVVVVGTIAKRFVLPEEAAEAKRHIRRATRKPRTRAQSGGGKKQVRKERK